MGFKWVANNLNPDQGRRISTISRSCPGSRLFDTLMVFQNNNYSVQFCCSQPLPPPPPYTHTPTHPRRQVFIASHIVSKCGAWISTIVQQSDIEAFFSCKN